MALRRRRPPRLRAAVAVGLAVTAGACASRDPRPGVGDISFRLAWQGEADLDLYVISPLDERIDFLHPEVPSGGRLDVDCNVTVPEPVPVAGGQATLEPRKLRCPRPLENVFWPDGAAPLGAYRVQVLLADGEGALASDRYRLEVRLGRAVVWSDEGPVLEVATEPVNRLVAFPPRP